MDGSDDVVPDYDTYEARFGDLDTRSMLWAGASLDDIDALCPPSYVQAVAIQKIENRPPTDCG